MGHSNFTTRVSLLWEFAGEEFTEFRTEYTICYELSLFTDLRRHGWVFGLVFGSIWRSTFSSAIFSKPLWKILGNTGNLRILWIYIGEYGYISIFHDNPFIWWASLDPMAPLCRSISCCTILLSSNFCPFMPMTVPTSDPLSVSNFPQFPHTSILIPFPSGAK